MKEPSCQEALFQNHTFRNKHLCMQETELETCKPPKTLPKSSYEVERRNLNSRNFLIPETRLLRCTERVLECDSTILFELLDNFQWPLMFTILLRSCSRYCSRLIKLNLSYQDNINLAFLFPSNLMQVECTTQVSSFCKYFYSIIPRI